jgi:hypothetical protein
MIKMKSWKSRFKPLKRRRRRSQLRMKNCRKFISKQCSRHDKHTKNALIKSFRSIKCRLRIWNRKWGNYKVKCKSRNGKTKVCSAIRKDWGFDMRNWRKLRRCCRPRRSPEAKGETALEMILIWMKIITIIVTIISIIMVKTAISLNKEIAELRLGRSPRIDYQLFQGKFWPKRQERIRRMLM